MQKLIQGSDQFEAIKNKSYAPDIQNTPENSEALKSFLDYTFANFPEVIKKFAEIGYDASVLNVIRELDD